MFEFLFFVTAVYMAYVAYEAYQAVGRAERGEPVFKPTPAVKPVSAPKPAAVKTDAPKPAAAPAKPATVSKPAPAAAKPAPAGKPASKAADKAPAAAPAKPASASAKATESVTLADELRNPTTGEVSPVPANYRFAKKWIKDALVSEKLLDRVYKPNELDDANSRKVKEAIDKLRAIKKYQA